MAWTEEFMGGNTEHRMSRAAKDNAQRSTPKQFGAVRWRAPNAQRSMKKHGANTERRTPNTAKENAQRPTSNVQRSMRRNAMSFRVLLCGADAGEENAN